MARKHRTKGVLETDQSGTSWSDGSRPTEEEMRTYMEWPGGYDSYFERPRYEPPRAPSAPDPVADEAREQSRQRLAQDAAARKRLEEGRRVARLASHRESVKAKVDFVRAQLQGMSPGYMVSIIEHDPERMAAFLGQFSEPTRGPYGSFLSRLDVGSMGTVFPGTTPPSSTSSDQHSNDVIR